MSARVEDVSASAAGRGLPCPPRTAPERVPPPRCWPLGLKQVPDCPPPSLLSARGRVSPGLVAEVVDPREVQCATQARP